MRYEKNLVLPERRKRTVRRDAEELIGKKGTELWHLILSDGGLRAACFCEKAYDLRSGCTRVYALRDKTFVYAPSSGRLYDPKDSTFYSGMALPPVAIIPDRHPETSDDTWWAVSTVRVSYFHGGTSFHYSSATGGTCAVRFKERTCFAAGHRLYYSAACTYAAMKNAGDDPNGFGYVDLYRPAAGTFVGAAVLNDKLFLFRKFGIDEFDMDFETLNFRALPVWYAGGEILPETVVLCGDKIRFLTPIGLYEFDGTKAKLIDTEMVEQINFSAGRKIETSCRNGTYCALVTRKDGKDAVLAYDAAHGYGYWIALQGAESFSACGDAYYKIGNTLYRLTDVGELPQNTECALRFPVKLEGDFAEWMEVDGEGEFDAELSTEEGKRTLSLGAGGKVRLDRPLRGETLSVDLKARGGEFLIKKISFGIAEGLQ